MPWSTRGRVDWWTRPIATVRAMALQQYRFRTPSSGREVILPADPNRIYLDRDTGEELEVVGKVLPLEPSRSRLPWALSLIHISEPTRH